MNSYNAVLSRVSSRLREPATVAGLAASLSALGVSIATSPGRKILPLAKKEEAMEETEDATASHQRKDTLQKLWHLIRLAIPSTSSKECRLLVGLVILMMTRIAITLRMANTMGHLAGAAMEGNMRGLMLGILRLLLSCIPVSLVDVTLDYTKEMLELSLRSSLSRLLFHRYLASKVFFRLAGLHEVDNVQVKITDGVERWCATVTTGFTSFTRAGLETIVFSRELWKRTGWRGPALTWLFYGIFSIYAFRFAPSGDRLATLRLRKVGEFRSAHQNIRTFAEEISLTQSSSFTRELTSRLFKKITDHARMASFLHCRFQLGNVAIFRYGTALVSILVGSLGVFHCPVQDMSRVETLRVYSKTTYTFSVLSTALNHILMNIRLFSSVTGYTHELCELFQGLEFAEEDVKISQVQTPLKCRSPVLWGSPTSFASSFDSIVSRGDHVEFINVPLTLPSGKCICKSLSFYVRQGMNLLITGPNGCGKSSTLRLLGELWPLQGGTMIKPPPNQLYYVPQRPYMFDGTLLEQIIYPHKREEMRVTEEKLYELLRLVSLDSLFTDLQMTWDSRVDSALSVGEKQRLALARLFYHCPQFAILDECSSTMDPDVERTAYESCQKLGISLITVAHRRSVWKYHNWVLRFDGLGGYVFSPLQVDEAREVIHLTSVTKASNSTVLGKALSFNFEEIITEETMIFS